MNDESIEVDKLLKEFESLMMSYERKIHPASAIASIICLCFANLAAGAPSEEDFSRDLDIILQKAFKCAESGKKIGIRFRKLVDEGLSGKEASDKMFNEDFLND